MTGASRTNATTTTHREAVPETAGAGKRRAGGRAAASRQANASRIPNPRQRGCGPASVKTRCTRWTSHDMKFTPRPYQQDATSAVLESFRERNSTLVVMPTGTGKTVVFALVGDAAEWGRVMVLAGRRELIEQARDKIRMVTGEVPDIEMGQQYAPTLSQDLFASGKYVCGSVQTVTKDRRLARWNWKDFGLIIIDEAHHALAPSYRKIVDRARAENPNIKVLFVTATPDRGDGKALGQICESVAYRLDLPDAIDDGWLVPIHQHFADITGLDFSHVRTVGGELDSDELDDIIRDDGGPVPHKIAAEMIKAAGNEKAVIFTPGVSSAYAVAEIIRRTRPDKAVALDGTWDEDKRRAVLAAYERGEFQYLLNCNLFLEGWDSCTTSVVGIARPMKMRNTYAQAVGRGVRPLPGVVDRWNDSGVLDTAANVSARRQAIQDSDKKRMLVVDIVGNSGRHKLVCTADILGGEYSQVVVAAAAARAKRNKGNSDMKRLLQEEQDKAIRKREDAEDRRAARKRRVYGQTTSATVAIDPFHLDVAPAIRDGFNAGPELLTAGQQEYLEKLGVPAAGMRKDDANRLIGKHKIRQKAGLCSLKQMHLLAQHGFPAEKMTKARASAVIDLLSANGWQRPAAPIQAEQLSIRPIAGGKNQLIVRTGGKKLAVGKPRDSVDSVREYGRLILGT